MGWAVLEANSVGQGVGLWALLVLADSVLEGLAVWTSGSDALSLLVFGEELLAFGGDAVSVFSLLGSGWADLLDAGVVLLGPSLLAGLDDALSVVKDRSFLTLLDDALAVLELGAFLALLGDDALSVLVWLRSVWADFSLAVLGRVLLEAWLAGHWLADGTDELESGVAGEGSALVSDLLGSLWASLSDAFSVDQLEVGGTSVSHALAVLWLEVLLAVGDANVVLQSPSGWAGFSDADSVLKLVESWAGGSDADVLLETVVGWAGELLADSVLGFDASLRADLAEALSSLEGGVLWTDASLADSVHEGEP